VNLEELVKQCHEDTTDWFPERPYDIPFLTLALAGEVGEVANLVKKVERGTHTFTELKPQITEELVDVLTYLSTLFGALEVDNLEEHYLAKRERNTERFAINPG
jgi:NTP pyrophosphatase (non-canonical NTP hydrolase)